ncbi:hypothetical protein WJX74_007616 [Apatococcus lobatus]|uniref:J domain-containing protein n=2 Tax=Apatococcus TaxID=904362 RepID=A0AAW1T2S3_9CHLO
MQFHPDKNPSPAARQRYQDIQLAARKLLGQAESRQHAKGAQQGAWSSASGDHTAWSRLSRSRAFPIVFCAASLVSGCLIFMAALHVHTDMYTYNIAEEVEQRRQAPTQMQQRIGQLLMERRQQEQQRCCAMSFGTMVALSTDGLVSLRFLQPERPISLALRGQSHWASGLLLHCCGNGLLPVTYRMFESSWLTICNVYAIPSFEMRIRKKLDD